MYLQIKSDALFFSVTQILRISQLFLFAVILTGCSTINLVTGTDDTTRLSGQSETDATTSFRGGVHRIVVAFNDETGGICDYHLKSCGWYENWTFGASRASPEESQRLDVFNPNVVAFPAFFGISPRWQGSFLTRYGNSTSTLNLTRATLGYVNGLPLTIPVDIARDASGCYDQRGYWGGYDGFLPVGEDEPSLGKTQSN